MNRWNTCSLLLALSLSGCGDAYEPAKQEMPIVPKAAEPAEPEALAEQKGQVTEGDAGGELSIGAIRMTVPDAWIRKPPRSQFVQAEFVLPAAEGDETDGRLTVSTAGGSIKANIDRWRGQFGGKPEEDTEEEREIAGLKVTVVDFSGTFNDQAGPFSPGVEREGYRMLGAIVPSGEMSHFIKAYGPAKTMAEHRAAFDEFLQGLQQQ